MSLIKKDQILGVVYAEDFNNMSVKEMAKNMVSINRRSETPKEVLNFSNLARQGEFLDLKRENLCFGLRGYKPEDGLCWEVADGLYLLLRYKFKDNGEYATYATLSADYLKSYFSNLEIEEAFEIAKANTLAQGIKFQKISEATAGMPEVPEIPDIGLYVLSYPKFEINGAVLIAFPEAIKIVQEGLGCEKFYIIPSSVHELLILPENLIGSDEFEISDFRDMIVMVNNTSVLPKDVLSDNLYYYDGEKIIVAA